MKQILVCGAALVFAALELSAGTILPPSYSASAATDGASVTGNGPGTYSYGRASVSVSTAPDLVLSATSHSSKDDAIGAGAGATVYYYFTVLGAADFEIVPLQITGNLYATASQGDSDNASGHAQLSVTTALENKSVDVWAATGGPSSSSWSGTLNFNYMGGYDNTGYNSVLLRVEAGENVGADSAYADPYITFDPSFVNTGGYSIEVSSGIANNPVSATVPEPQSMVLFGIGITGFILLRRRLA